jgi:hypothetical protein
MDKRKKKSFWYYLNPENLSLEVSRYGYTFSMKNYWKKYLLACTGILLLGLWYGLKTGYILAVILYALVLSPFIIINTCKNAGEEKDFEDISNYLEQLLYSFKRVPKILTSLEDTAQVFPEGKMHRLVQQSIHRIQSDTTEENIYRAAFLETEKEYCCRRLVQTHDFLIKAEEIGGDFSNALTILLLDRQMWVERVYEMAQQRRNIRRNILISLLLSAGICKISMIMLPKEFMALTHPLSQTVTAAYMISGITIWFWGQKKLQASWLREDISCEEEVQKEYEYLEHYRAGKNRKNNLKKVLPVLPFLAICIWRKAKTMAVCFLGAAVMLWMQPGLRHRLARKRIKKEVEKSFPIWLMDLSLLMQTENVHNALEKSVDKAPYVLKKELTRLVEAIERNPDSIEPFLDFMPWMDLPDVQSALRLIYSMWATGDGEDMEKQISVLVERNHHLMDKAERIANEDALAGAGMLVLIPMVTGSVKMMTDMGLLLVGLMNITKGMV